MRAWQSGVSGLVLVLVVWLPILGCQRNSASEEDHQRLRAAHREEVKQCEEVLQGEWVRPGLCCVWTAMGCAELSLRPVRQGPGNG